MKKWKIEVTIVLVLMGIAIGVLWFIHTNPERKTNAQFEQLVKYANRQEVEIAIIKQDAELRMLKQALAVANQRQQKEIAVAKQNLQNKLK